MVPAEPPPSKSVGPPEQIPEGGMPGGNGHIGMPPSLPRPPGGPEITARSAEYPHKLQPPHRAMALSNHASTTAGGHGDPRNYTRMPNGTNSNGSGNDVDPQSIPLNSPLSVVIKGNEYENGRIPSRLGQGANDRLSSDQIPRPVEPPLPPSPIHSPPPSDNFKSASGPGDQRSSVAPSSISLGPSVLNPSPHLQPSSVLASCLLAEDFTANTMKVVHGMQSNNSPSRFPPPLPSSGSPFHVSHPSSGALFAASGGSHHGVNARHHMNNHAGSSHPLNPANLTLKSPSMAPATLPGPSSEPSANIISPHHQRMEAKRTMADKLGSGSFAYFNKPAELMSDTNKATLLRRFSRLKNGLPTAVNEAVSDGPPTPLVEKRVPEKSYNRPRNQTLDGVVAPDGDATDTEDYSAGRVSAMSYEAFKRKIRLHSTLDREAKLQERQRQIQERISKYISQNSNADEYLYEMLKRREGYECARLIPWDRTYRRVLKRGLGLPPPLDSNRVNMKPNLEAAMLYDQSTDTTAYIHRIGTVPAAVVRKRADKSIVFNRREVGDERERNGQRRKDEAQKREKRRLEQPARDDSDEYEDTDETDDENYLPKELRRPNGAPPAKKQRVEGRKQRKEKRRRKNREGANPPLPISKLGRRCSTFVNNRLSSNSRPSFDRRDDIVYEPSAQNIPKLEYADIYTPAFRKDDEPTLTVEDALGPDPEVSESLMEQVARLHHELEFNERKSFTDHSNNSRARAARPPVASLLDFDFSAIAPTLNSSRLSCVSPYRDDTWFLMDFSAPDAV